MDIREHAEMRRSRKASTPMETPISMFRDVPAVLTLTRRLSIVRHWLQICLHTIMVLALSPLSPPHLMVGNKLLEELFANAEFIYDRSYETGKFDDKAIGYLVRPTGF